MNFIEQLKKLLQDAKDDKDVQAHLAELRKPTTEGIAAFLDSEEGKKLVSPRLDQAVTKGIDSFKKNNLEKLVEERYNQLHPPETEEQKRVRKLEEDLAKEKNERIRETLKNKLLSQATTKGLPVGLVEYFIGEDEEKSLKNLGILEQAWGADLKTAVDKRFANGGREPAGGGEPPKTFTREQMKDPKFVNDNWPDIQAAMAAGTIKP